MVISRAAVPRVLTMVSEVTDTAWGGQVFHAALHGGGRYIRGLRGGSQRKLTRIPGPQTEHILNFKL